MGYFMPTSLFISLNRAFSLAFIWMSRNSSACARTDNYVCQFKLHMVFGTLLTISDTFAFGGNERMIFMVSNFTQYLAIASPNSVHLSLPSLEIRSILSRSLRSLSQICSKSSFSSQHR